MVANGLHGLYHQDMGPSIWQVRLSHCDIVSGVCFSEGGEDQTFTWFHFLNDLLCLILHDDLFVKSSSSHHNEQSPVKLSLEITFILLGFKYDYIFLCPWPCGYQISPLAFSLSFSFHSRFLCHGCSLVDCFLVDTAAVSVTFSPTGDVLASAHVDSLGIYLW